MVSRAHGVRTARPRRPIILADPRNDSIRDTINAKIKKRELFRPFAPSVKEEAAAEYFDISQKSPFMNLSVPVRAHQRDRNSSRGHPHRWIGQNSNGEWSQDNPRYWSLLDRFEKETGVPTQ